MARKRRKRNRNRRSAIQQATGVPTAPDLAPSLGYGLDHHAVGLNEEPDDDEESRLERGKELLDEVMIDAGAIPGVTKTDFVEGGYTCTECPWITRKKKTNGVQALRAHSKRHVRDRRATRNSLLLNLVVLAIGLFIGASSELIVKSLFMNRLDFYSPDIPIAVDILERSIAAVSVTLAAIVLFVSIQYITTGRRKWSRSYKWLERLWITYFIFVAAMMWTDIGQTLEIIWVISILLPWLASLFVRGGVAKTRLTVVRREFEPQGQLKLFRSKDIWIDFKIQKLTRLLKEQIRDGRVKLPDLRRSQLEYLRRLGLGGVQVSPTLEVKRVSQERREMQTKARTRAAKDRTKQREREGKLRRVKRSRGNDQILRSSD
ncbi:MAG: hypothetical protein IH867_09675 [Chloroflexi bacterium]|nr:hypothetical protein [Chloroflexota bacterium]